MSIHPTAIISPKTKIGQNVQIDAYAIVGEDVTLGDGCHLMSHSVLEHVELGAGCVVFPHTSIGLAPQHLGYKGEKTKVVVGENCVFREGVIVHRGTLFDQGVTLIGKNGFFMALSHIAHDCKIGDSVIMANAAQLAGHVEVGNRCFISTTVGIHQYVRIGEGALVSGGAMVPMDVAPFCIAQGDRASLKGLNSIGMRRAGVPRASMKLLKEAFKIVFTSGMPLKEALQDPGLNGNDPYVLIFKNFLAQPKRGFIRPELKLSADEKREEEEISA